MDGLAVKDGKLTIKRGSRIVASTDGTLVCLLPSIVSFTGTVTLPDFKKDYWRDWYFDETITDKIVMDEHANFYITAIPQEYSKKAVLQAAPKGADFFVGRVRLKRTAAPKHGWYDGPIDVLVDQNVWIPWTGSAVVEQQFGMARAIHIYLDLDKASSTFGKLVLEAQQSVSTAPGGWGPYGDDGPAVEPPQEAYGGIAGYNKTKGIPVYAVGSVGGRRTYPLDVGFAMSGFGVWKTYTANDPTNYASTYQVEITGQFGRRS